MILRYLLTVVLLAKVGCAGIKDLPSPKHHTPTPHIRTHPAYIPHIYVPTHHTHTLFTFTFM